MSIDGRHRIEKAGRLGLIGPTGQTEPAAGGHFNSVCPEVGLLLHDGTPDPLPHALSLDVAPIEHRIGPARGFEFGIDTMATDEEVVGIIYFLGTSPGHYQPIIPTFILGWHPERLRVQLAFGAIVGASAQAVPPEAPERRYALREVKARLHQASFRDAVLTSCGERCAISHLPEPRVLDAAQMVIDADEQLGQPIIPNGLPLTKLHHAAFDAQLVGIDPDFRIYVSDRLLEIHDGPFLELGLKGIAGHI